MNPSFAQLTTTWRRLSAGVCWRLVCWHLVVLASSWGRADEAVPPVSVLSPPAAVAEPSAAATSEIIPPVLAAPSPDVMAEFERRLDQMQMQIDAQAVSIKPEPKTTTFPTFKFTGFTQLDCGYFTQNALNKAEVGDAQDGIGFRRARLGFVGSVAEFTNYSVEFDFATAGRPSFFDVWVEQTNVPYLGALRGGHFCQPFSVDAMSGFRNLTFLERSLPFLAFVPFRKLGFMAYSGSEDEMTHWAYSVFRTGGFNNNPLGDTRFSTDIGDSGGYSFSSRVTRLLYFDEHAKDRYLWHVGGSYDFSKLGANTAPGSPSPVPFYQSRTTPEFGPLGYTDVSEAFGQAFATNPVYVDSGRFPASKFNLFGLETLAQNGAWGFQSEWMGTYVSTNFGDVFYHGAYAQLAYRLTGENRAYDKQQGSLGKLVPYTDFFSLERGKRGVHGWGAWEVAYRWSYVDIRNPDSFNGHYLNGTSAAGNGILNDSTVDLTWFLNTHTKLQFNWICALLNNTGYAAAGTPALSGHTVSQLYVSRLQVDY